MSQFQRLMVQRSVKIATKTENKNNNSHGGRGVYQRDKGGAQNAFSFYFKSCIPCSPLI